MSWHRAVAAALALVAVGSVGVAWWQDVPELSAADAVAAAEGAFRGAGVDAVVAPDPVRATYVPRDRAPVDVWAVRATVRAQPVELQLARSGAHPVALDDRSIDGYAYVLSELEYESITRHVDDPARKRTVARNVSLTAAAVLIVAMAIVLAAAHDPKGPR